MNIKSRVVVFGKPFCKSDVIVYNDQKGMIKKNYLFMFLFQKRRNFNTSFFLYFFSLPFLSTNLLSFSSDQKKKSSPFFLFFDRDHSSLLCKSFFFIVKSVRFSISHLSLFLSIHPSLKLHQDVGAWDVGNLELVFGFGDDAWDVDATSPPLSLCSMNVNSGIVILGCVLVGKTRKLGVWFSFAGGDNWWVIWMLDFLWMWR